MKLNCTIALAALESDPDTLSVDFRRGVQEHVAECQPCREKFNAAADEIATSLPERLKAAVMQAANELGMKDVRIASADPDVLKDSPELRVMLDHIFGKRAPRMAPGEKVADTVAARISEVGLFDDGGIGVRFICSCPKPAPCWQQTFAITPDAADRLALTIMSLRQEWNAGKDAAPK